MRARTANITAAAVSVTLAVAATAAAAAVVSGPWPTTPATAAATATPAPVAPAAAALTDLADVPPDPPAAYERDAFGSGWADPDGNGCDGREDVLARDVLTPTSTAPCRIVSGTVIDAYTGLSITGPTRLLDVDHTVALADAWRSGAAAWTRQTRVQFANDLRNLVLTTQHTNRSKGDLGPDEWAPADHTAACSYAERYVTVKHAYRLTVTDPQRAALTATLSTC